MCASSIPQKGESPQGNTAKRMNPNDFVLNIYDILKIKSFMIIPIANEKF